jgi:RimJ/RimL family protein N-acetyltransferase
MPLLVRTLGPDDWEVLRDIRLAALQDSPGAFLSTYEQSLDRTETEWRAWPARGDCFAAFADGEPVGMVGVAPDEAPQSAELFARWVAPPARGSGAADALIRAAVDWARAHGCASVHLEVAAGNDRAERVYARHGFVPSGAPTMIACGLAMRLTFA